LYAYHSFQSISGIGLESAILFAQEGANVLLVDINMIAAEKGARTIADRFPDIKAIPMKVDVGKEVDVKAAVDLAVKEFGRLDVMVGHSFPFLPITDSIIATVQQCWWVVQCSMSI